MTDRAFVACEALATANGSVFFGLEFPEGYKTVGHAQCLMLSSFPYMKRVPDSECEAEGLFQGKRLGGTSHHNLAQTIPQTFR